MTQRIALSIAAALSAFVLIVIAGVAARVTQTPVSAVPTVATTAVPSTAAALDPTAQAIIAERDAAYQAALAQANARIAAANAQVDQANVELAQANTRLEQANAATAAAANASEPAAAPASASAAEPVAPTTASYPISADEARKLAQSAAYGLPPTQAPELVRLKGIPAYEVRFAQGLVYIDANSGAVLSSTLPDPAAASQPNQRYDHERDEHDGHEGAEHEGGHDD